MKKEPKATRKFDKDREFTVILERIHTDFRAFGDGQDLLRDKLDATIGRVGKITEDVTMLKLQTSGIKNDIEKINGKLAGMEMNIGTLKSDVGTLKSDVGTLKSDVGTLKSDVGTLKSDVRRIDGRLEKFEENTDKRLTRLESIVK